VQQSARGEGDSKFCSGWGLERRKAHSKLGEGALSSLRMGTESVERFQKLFHPSPPPKKNQIERDICRKEEEPSLASFENMGSSLSYRLNMFVLLSWSVILAPFSFAV